MTDQGWLVLLALGGVHGINPAMGWLFAVALGLQERDRRAVWRALGPLALGHALAIAAAVMAATALGILVPLQWLKWGVAAALIGLGIRQLVRHRHGGWGGMRVSPTDLTIWSFLIASAHGAGLMALPFVVGHEHGMVATSVVAPVIHTGGYLVATGGLAVLVYEKLGLKILKRAWINLTPIWVAALFVTGLLTPWL